MKQKIETRLKLTGYYLEILTFETMKLLRSTKSNTKKMKMVKMFLIWFTKVVLVHCNIVNNNYQQKLRVLYTFLPKKLFGQILVDPPEKKENYIFKNV